MSSTAKTGIAIVVIIIIVVVGWLVLGSKSGQQTASTNPTPTSVPNSAVSPSPAAQVPTTAGTGMAASSDTSNAALQQDSSAVDSQMNGLSTDQTNIDSGLSTSNTPVQQ